MSLKPWKPGIPSPNPSGRPRGVRNRLNTKLLEALLADFEEHGVTAIKIFRMEDPGGYVKAVLSTLPREFAIETAMADMDDDSLDQLIAQIRARVMPPAEPVLLEGETVEKVKETEDETK